MTNIKLTTDFLTSYIDGVRTLPLSPERVAKKRFFSFFSEKSQRRMVTVYLRLRNSLTYLPTCLHLDEVIILWPHYNLLFVYL